MSDTTTVQAPAGRLPGIEVDVFYAVDEASEPVVERVRILNPDQIRWDLTRNREDWPAAKDAPMLATSFLAWAALKRLGRYAAPWETFRDRDCLDIHDAPAAEVVPTDPSPSAPAADS